MAALSIHYILLYILKINNISIYKMVKKSRKSVNRQSNDQATIKEGR